MGYTVEALLAARENLEIHLSGKGTISAIRTKVRKTAEGKGRVLRRDGEPVHDWGVKLWPVTIEDVLAAQPQEYAQVTILWAKSTLDAIKNNNGVRLA